MIRIQAQVVTILVRRKVVLFTQWLHQEEIAWVLKVKLQAQEHITISMKTRLEAELQIANFQQIFNEWAFVCNWMSFGCNHIHICVYHMS